MSSAHDRSYTVLPSQSHTEGAQFDPWLIWVTFRRSWHWAVPVGLVLACLAGYAVLKSFVPIYQASHLLEANSDFILYKGVMPTVDDVAKTESPIILNRVVLDSVLTESTLRGAPSLSDPETAEKNLRANLSIKSAGSKTRMSVSYKDSDRDYAARVCNAVVSSYLRQRADTDQTRVNNLESLLIPEIDYWKREVENQKEKVRSLSEEVLGYNVFTQLETQENASKLSRLDELRSKIGDLKVDVVLWEARLEVIRQENATEQVVATDVIEDSKEFVPAQVDFSVEPIDPSELQQLISADASVVEAVSEVARFQGQMKQLEDSDLVRLNRQRYRELEDKRDEWTEKLQTARETAEQRVTTVLEEKAKQEYAQKVAQLETENEIQRKLFNEAKKLREKTRVIERKAQQSEEEQMLVAQVAEKNREITLLQKEYDAVRAEQEQHVGRTATLQFAQDDLARATELLNKLQDRVAQIRTERRQLNAVRSLAIATPPSHPVESLPFKKLLAASGAGFVVPFLIGLLWEIRTNRVTDSLALDKSVGIAPVVGELARSPSVSSGRHSRGRRVFQESVDTLRANLFLSKDTRDSRSIAIVSSMSGEGKSTTASQLAISLAKATGKTVLLIDGDMRCPDQHDIFGLSLEPGLSGVLSGSATLDEAIQTELGDLIHVLPAGRLKASPHRLMSPEAMKDFVNSALERYEYVIFDTAPVLSAGETLAVSAAVDTTLICAMRDVTRKESVVRTTHRLESAGANVAGTVFNGVTPRQYAYRYGDYNYSNFVSANDASAAEANLSS